MSRCAKLAPKDAASLKEFQRVVGTALRVMVNSELPKEVGVANGPVGSLARMGSRDQPAVIGRKDEKDAVPVLGVLGPKVKGEQGRRLAAPEGKGESVRERQGRTPALKTLTDAGVRGRRAGPARRRRERLRQSRSPWTRGSPATPTATTARSSRNAFPMR